MSPRFGAYWLLIIPCCARKTAGRAQIGNDGDPLAKLVTPERYSAMIAARRAVIESIRDNREFTREKYFKNTDIKDGADFGGQDMSGSYMPALTRYAGTLYGVPGLKSAIERTAATKADPQIMILSALYGPLHPLSPIQDYNLMMQDAPARAWSKEFPAFLTDYAQRNGVGKIGLYLGSSTAYLRVAAKAVAEMRNSGLISEAVQYHIVDGSTRATPLKHGSRLLCDLGGPLDPSLYDPAQICKRAF
jgi:hypothetical protein